MMAWINWSQIALSPNLSRDSAARVRTCGSSCRSSRSNSQMRKKAALCSFSLPSGPNTATPSLSVFSVADWTLIRVL